MAGVGRTLVRCEERERERDEPADLVEAARPGGPQERFQLGEREFDRIEVGAVRGEEAHKRPDLLDRDPDGGLFVGQEVVEYDDIPRPERRDQDLFHVGEERRIVDGAIEDRGRAQPLDPEGGNHGVGVPVPARGVIAQARAARATAVAAKQVGGHAAFIEKDVVPHIAERLRGAPPSTLSGDVGPALLVGVYGFF